MKFVDEKSGMAKNNRSRTWLLLRGLTRGQGHWGNFPELLQARYPNDKVILLDLPGNGAENHFQSPWHLRDYVEFLRDRLKDQKFEGELHVLAVSLGAMTVIEWMKNYPHEITQSCLINVSLKGSGHFYERLLPNNYPKLLKALKIKNTHEREKLILEMTSRNVEAQQKWLSSFAEYSEKYPVHKENLVRQLTAALRAETPEQSPGKVKIFISRNDNFINSVCGFRIAEEWGISPLVHSWGGHDLTLDDPEWVVNHL